jgi:hypothetical protein
VLKNMALFLAAPFIGLLYAVLLPVVGMGMLLWVATEGWRKPAPARQEEPATPAAVAVAEAPAPVQAVAAIVAEETRPMGIGDAALIAVKVLAAPFIGLAFIVVMPFAGLAMLAWMGLKAAFVRTA